jgi:hypothetical protein
MPISIATSLNNTGVKSFKDQKAIPDYSILFWHRINDWNTVNSIHGIDPSVDNNISKIFRQYDIGYPKNPDVVDEDSYNLLNEFNYVVRCVSSSSNWPTLCDVRYNANTNMSANQSTLLDIAGGHSYNLLGRVAPPLINDLQSPFSDTTNYTVYTSDHIGHFHQAEGLQSKLLTVNPSNTESFASFFVDPIFKDPLLNYLKGELDEPIICLLFLISSIN